MVADRLWKTKFLSRRGFGLRFRRRSRHSLTLLPPLAIVYSKILSNCVPLPNVIRRERLKIFVYHSLRDDGTRLRLCLCRFPQRSAKPFQSSFVPGHFNFFLLIKTFRRASGVGPPNYSHPFSLTF